tara:strand:- start:5343 stop:5984 length:642 start_codon:yes stop_codon:yes gene_type:complete
MAIFTGTAAAGGLAIKALMAKLGIGAAAKAVMAKGAIGAGLNAAGKVAAVQGPRMAASGAFKQGLGNAVFGNMGKGEIVSRLAPDAFFGGMAALQTPGDIGDKLIAGGTSALGGGLGGIALSRGASRLGIEGTGNYIADMAGSVGGDMFGMGLGDGLMRGKDKIAGGAGMTPYERMSAEQQEQFAEEIRQQTLAGAGLVPGIRDQYMYGNGMG